MMTPEQIAQSIDTIYSFPDVILKLNELIDDPRTEIKDMVTVIECDPALTLKILRLSNSSFYGFKFPVESINKAVQIVGMNEIRNFAVSAQIVNMFNKVSPDLINMETYWHNSIFCGFFAKNLGVYCGFLENNPLFIAGLLHGVGQLVMCSQYVDQYRQVMYRHNEPSNIKSQISAERAIFGFDYADLSYEILKRWKIPNSIVNMVKSHLAPDSRESEILHVSHAMMVVTQNNGDIENIANSVDAELMDRLGVNIDTLKALRSESFMNMLEMIDIIKPGSFKIN